MTTPMKENVVAWPSSNPVPRPKAGGDGEERIRLIFVDDDDDYREAAAAELVDLRFTVETFADGASMLASGADGIVADGIVLDWSLPNMSGIDLLPPLLREGILQPVFFLPAQPTPSQHTLTFDPVALRVSL